MDNFKDKRIITSDQVPQAIGPYSIGIQSDGLIFTSGQLGLDPVTGELVGGGIESETRQALTNLQNVLEAAEADLHCVVKTTVFLLNIGDFPKMNAVYADFFTKDPPARTTVAVKDLPKGACVEIEAIAIRERAAGK